MRREASLGDERCLLRFDPNHAQGRLEWLDRLRYAAQRAPRPERRYEDINEPFGIPPDLGAGRFDVGPAIVEVVVLAHIERTRRGGVELDRLRLCSLGA